MNKYQTLLSEFEYTPNYSQEAFAAAEDFLKRSASFGGTANFGLFGDNGVCKVYTHASCHASLAGNRTNNDKFSLIATEAAFDPEPRGSDNGPYHVDPRYPTRARRGRRADGVMDGFFKWFVYESLFSRFILNKDSESIKRGFIISTDLPPAITQSICIVGRHFFEVLDRSFIKFDELVALGVPKSVAYVTAFNGYYSYSYTPREENTVFVPLYNHRLFAFPEELVTLVNFAEGKCRSKNLSQKPFREYPSYYGCGDLFFSRSSDNTQPTYPFTRRMLREDPDLRAFLQSIRGTVPELPKVVNPFVPASPRNLAADPLNVLNDEMFKIIVYLTEKGVFKNAVH